jgi:hypothetical protein
MIDTCMFRSFARTAIGLQADTDTPGDYTMVKAAVEAKYGIVKQAWNSGELAGLGILAAPSASSLVGRPWDDKAKDVSEVAGLGLLAAPYAHNIAAARSARYANSGIGQKLSKVFKH